MVTSERYPIATEGSRPPALGEMMALYEACNRLCEISKRQFDLADDMGLIALNAEIAAAKSTLNQEAFSVLAYETGQIARFMSRATSELYADSAMLARTSLQGLEKARQLDRLQEGLSGIRTVSNIAVVGKVVDSLQEVVAGTFTTLLDRLDLLAESHQKIARSLVKISRIITYFRIEASRDEQYGSYFLNIAEELTQLGETATSVSETMQEIIDRALA